MAGYPGLRFGPPSAESPSRFTVGSAGSPGWTLPDGAVQYADGSRIWTVKLFGRTLRQHDMVKPWPGSACPIDMRAWGDALRGYGTRLTSASTVACLLALPLELLRKSRLRQGVNDGDAP